jgi:hypothetical protein
LKARIIPFVAVVGEKLRKDIVMFEEAKAALWKIRRLSEAIIPERFSKRATNAFISAVLAETRNTINGIKSDDVGNEALWRICLLAEEIEAKQFRRKESDDFIAAVLTETHYAINEIEEIEDAKQPPN